MGGGDPGEAQDHARMPVGGEAEFQSEDMNQAWQVFAAKFVPFSHSI
jgi:hypothetical protein